MDDRQLVNKLNEAELILQEVDFCRHHLSVIRQLQQKQLNKELNIPVVGQFKRGKSSFINAVLQEPILPVGIVPITSVVTKIKYGSEGSHVHFNDGTREKVSLEKLVHYISELNNPENRKQVDSVTIHSELDALRTGMTIVDTPGVGSTHKHNTLTAYSFLKESDAVVFMLSVDSPINEIEEAFLREARKSAVKFYFAVNKIDTLSAPDLEQYMAYCAAKLREIMETDAVELYPVSAKTRIGIDSIMAAIGDDLKDHRDRILIDSTTVKLDDLLADALSRMHLYVNAVALPLEKLAEKKNELNGMLTRLDGLQKMAHIRMAQQTDSLIQEIQDCFQRHRHEAEADLAARLEATYQENRDKKPRQLEKVLLSHLEQWLTHHLETMNHMGMDQLAEGYEAMTGQLHQELVVISDFVSEMVMDLFSVDITHAFPPHQVSGRSDYYISIKQPKDAFIIDLNKLVYLLPRNRGNQLVYEKVRALMRDDLERNQNNMVYNCRYKLQESLRSFRGQLQQETEGMKTDLLRLMDRIEQDRNRTSDEVSDSLQVGERLIQRLASLRSAGG